MFGSSLGNVTGPVTVSHYQILRAGPQPVQLEANQVMFHLQPAPGVIIEAHDVLRNFWIL